MRDYGYFDPDKVTRLMAKLRKAKVPSARDNMAFVGMLSTQLWHAQFVAGADAWHDFFMTITCKRNHNDHG